MSEKTIIEKLTAIEKLSVKKRIAIITNEIRVGKDGRNTFSNYDYLKPDSLLNTLNPLLEKYNLITHFNLEKIMEKDNTYKATLTVEDTESDSKVIYVFDIDKASVKGANEAQNCGATMTYGKRYSLTNAFNIADNDIDLDSDKMTDKTNDKNKSPDDKNTKKNLDTTIVTTVSSNTNTETKPKTETPIETKKESEQKIEKILSDITKKITELRSKGIDDQIIGGTIKGTKISGDSTFGKMNYAGIKDVKIAQKVLDTITSAKFTAKVVAEATPKIEKTGGK